MQQDQIERMPPQAIEAEQAVVGTMINSIKALRVSREILKQSSFYHLAHGVIFQAICDLYSAEGHVDLVTLPSYLKDIGKLDEIGGSVYIAKLASNNAMSPTGINHYCKIIKDVAVRRYLIEQCVEIQSLAYDDGTDGMVLAEKVSGAMKQALRDESRTGFSGMAEIQSDVSREFDRAKASGRRWAGLDCGFPRINDTINGLCQEEFTILGARPAIGKTRLAMQMARNVAVNEKKGVAIFSLEMSKRQLGQYLICTEAGIDNSRFRRGDIDAIQHQDYLEAKDRINSWSIFIDDTSALTIPQLIAGTERLQDEQEIGLVIIDYLQLMKGPGDTRNEMFDVISQSLKDYSKEFHMPVLVVSQLSRMVENRTDKRPHMGDLRDCGAIEQNAVNVLLIYRPGYYDELVKAAKKKGIEESAFLREVDILAEKTRFGPTGILQLEWDNSRAMFLN